MARTHGRLFCSIWDDDEFLALSPYAKLAYSYLVSQDDLTHAGTIIMRTPLWAEEIGISDEEADAALNELHAEKFVVMDRRRFELLVRSLVRRDGVYKQPNVYKSAIESMRVVSSRPIRAALAEELARLDETRMNAEIQKLHADIIDWLRQNSDGPGPKGSAKGSGNPVCPDSNFGTESGVSDQGVSEIRQESMIAPSVALDEEPAGQVLDFKGSAKGSDKGSPPRAFSTYPFPLTKEEPSSSATATPPADGLSIVKSKRGRKKANPQPRPDVEALCNRLAELMIARGCRKPNVSNRWHAAARLLLDKDGIHPQFAMDVLEWSQKSDFWKPNILSMPKFREKWDTLYQQAEAACGPHPNNGRAPEVAGAQVVAFGGNVVAIRPNIPAPRPSTTDRAVASGDTALAEFRRMTGRLA